MHLLDALPPCTALVVFLNYPPFYNACFFLKKIILGIEKDYQRWVPFFNIQEKYTGILVNFNTSQI